MNAKVRKARRAGASVTVGVSLDVETKQKLKALAAARHQGNVSALITEMTEDAVRRAAFERAWAWYGGPEPTDAVRAKVDAELEEGWALARKSAAKAVKKRSRHGKAA
jgi:LmbE family N-acetylglucosaminyl deacetylase